MVIFRKLSARQKALAGALAATLLATWWASSFENESEDLLAPTVRRQAPTAVTGARSVANDFIASAPQPAAASASGRAAWPQAGALLIPAPPPPPSIEAPVTPVAAEPLPPLPFKYVGVIGEESQQAVILMQGENVHILKAGESVDDLYRIERITHARIEFLYIPLSQRQTLEIAPYENLP